jgi:hypothetical protein
MKTIESRSLPKHSKMLKRQVALLYGTLHFTQHSTGRISVNAHNKQEEASLNKPPLIPVFSLRQLVGNSSLYVHFAGHIFASLHTQ